MILVTGSTGLIGREIVRLLSQQRVAAWVWFLSVWQTGPAGQRVSRTNAEWRKEFQETLIQQLLAGFKAVAPRYSDFWGLGCDCFAF
jgi:nucleoside-diphosphate-sugar epimerase